MVRRKRCPNGSRRNLKTNQCERKKRRLRSNSKRTRRCPNGSRRRPPKTGQCVKNKKKSLSRTLTLPSRTISNSRSKSRSKSKSKSKSKSFKGPIRMVKNGRIVEKITLRNGKTGYMDLGPA